MIEMMGPGVAEDDRDKRVRRANIRTRAGPMKPRLNERNPSGLMQPGIGAAAEQPGFTVPTTNPNAHSLSVAGLGHSFGSKKVLDEISFEIPAGQVAAILGPSGCGKTTVLRAIAGLIRPQSGTIRLGDMDLAGLHPRERRIGLVFQSFALFPHLSVAQNIGYPLACRRAPRHARKKRVAELVQLLRLDGLETRLPRELSGGQQQRVAVGRALAADPFLLLLDEPFGALDRALRLDLQVELLKLQRSLGTTTLIVTHDQEEAQTLASRLVLMNEGRVEQIGSPPEIYDSPVSLFANRFIGQSNQIQATVLEVATGVTSLRLSTGDHVMLRRSIDTPPGAQVLLTFRPEHVHLRSKKLPGALKAQSLVTLPLGPTLIHDVVLLDGTEIKALETRRTSDIQGFGEQAVYVELDLDRCNVFRSDERQK